VDHILLLVVVEVVAVELPGGAGLARLLAAALLGVLEPCAPQRREGRAEQTLLGRLRARLPLARPALPGGLLAVGVERGPLVGSGLRAGRLGALRRGALGALLGRSPARLGRPGQEALDELRGELARGAEGRAELLGDLLGL
jgi:hypothetical protein